MQAKIIRCQKDLDSYEELLNHPEVKSAQAKLQTLEEKSAEGATRRQLLASAIRISNSISPAMVQMTQDCMKILGIDIDVELYVFSSPQFNAVCYKPENEKLYLGFSSSILEGFSEEELRYVIGHELGHHIYGHHGIPIGYMLHSSNKVNPELALKLFEWSRFAEISADRAGAICAKDFTTVASALFKLSSGISDFGIINFDFSSYLNQIEELIQSHKREQKSSMMQDWFSTHPLSPLRVKALNYFFDSSFIKKEGLAPQDLEEKVEQALSIMEPDYLRGNSAESKALREFFVAGAIQICMLDGEITKEEKKIFSKLLDNTISLESLDAKKLNEDLQKRADKVNETASPFEKNQVLRDLSLLALSDSIVSTEEERELSRLAKMLNINHFSASTISSKETFLD